MPADIEKPQPEYLSADELALFDRASAGALSQAEANQQVCLLLQLLASANSKGASIRAYVAGKYGETVGA